jgi:hypothetical protein
MTSEGRSAKRAGTRAGKQKSKERKADWRGHHAKDLGERGKKYEQIQSNYEVTGTCPVRK